MIDGVRQNPGQVTGKDGCTTWNDLTPGLIYGLEEDVPSDGQALTPVSHSFGMVEPMAQLRFSFINARLTQPEQNVYLPIIVRP